MANEWLWWWAPASREELISGQRKQISLHLKSDFFDNVWIEYFLRWKRFNHSIETNNGIVTFISEKLVNKAIADVRCSVARSQEAPFGKYGLNS